MTITSITDEEVLGQDFNPLAEEVVQNFNTPPPQNPTGQPLNEKPLPEAEMFGGTQQKTATNNGGSTGGEKFNKDFENLPEEEQEEGAEQTADLIIYGYSQLKMLVPKAISISERTLKKKEKIGEINLSIPFRRSPNDNRPITIGQMVHQFNESIIKPFEISQEFKEAIKPILVSILKRKGVVLSPEHLGTMLLVQDVVQTTVIAARCMGDRREVMQDLKNLTEEYAKSNRQNTTQQTSASQPFAPNRSEPDEVKVNVNTDNIQTLEATQQDKKEATVTVTEISKKMVDREEKKAQRKKREKKVTTPKVRKQRVVVKAVDSRTQQN